eukprot:jgi/Mesvir1/4829/Mv11115-RA.2
MSACFQDLFVETGSNLLVWLLLVLALLQRCWQTHRSTAQVCGRRHLALPHEESGPTRQPSSFSWQQAEGGPPRAQAGGDGRGWPGSLLEPLLEGSGEHGMDGVTGVSGYPSGREGSSAGRLLAALPSHRVGWLRRASFQWVRPLLAVGRRRPLEMDDLWQLPQALRPAVCAAKVQDCWDAELMRSHVRGEQEGSLARTLAHAFGWEFFPLGALKFLNDALGMMGPLLLHALVSSLSSSGDGSNGLLSLSSTGNGHDGVGAEVSTVVGNVSARLLQGFNNMTGSANFPSDQHATTIYGGDYSSASVNGATADLMGCGSCGSYRDRDGWYRDRNGSRHEDSTGAFGGDAGRSYLFPWWADDGPVGGGHGGKSCVPLVGESGGWLLGFDGPGDVLAFVWSRLRCSRFFVYLVALALAVSAVLQALLGVQYSYRLSCVGLRVKGALTVAIYRKTLAIGSSRRGGGGGGGGNGSSDTKGAGNGASSSSAAGGDGGSGFSTGQVQTLMAVDVDRAVNLVRSFHELWTLPLQITVALFLLYKQVRYAFLAGLAVVVILMLLNRVVVRRIGNASTRMMAAKDARVWLMAELLAGMRHLKMFAWEAVFARKVAAVRKEEVSALAVRKYLDAWCVYLWACTSVLFSLLTFGLFAVTGHTLDAATAFTSLALFNVLISPLNAFPWVINGVVEALVSVRRLQRFLSCPEMQPPLSGPSVHPAAASSHGAGSSHTHLPAREPSYAADVFADITVGDDVREDAGDGSAEGLLGTLMGAGDAAVTRLASVNEHESAAFDGMAATASAGAYAGAYAVASSGVDGARPVAALDPEGLGIGGHAGVGADNIDSSCSDASPVDGITHPPHLTDSPGGQGGHAQAEVGWGSTTVGLPTTPTKVSVALPHAGSHHRHHDGDIVLRFEHATLCWTQATLEPDARGRRRTRDGSRGGDPSPPQGLPFSPRLALDDISGGTGMPGASAPRVVTRWCCPGWARCLWPQGRLQGGATLRSTQDLAAVSWSAFAAARAAAEETALDGSMAGEVLSDVTLSIPRGHLAVLVGGAAAGKSSLLAAVLGEMCLLRGRLWLERGLREAGVGYLPQPPWILAGTVRENVLLGAPMDADRYRAVLHACALEEDLAGMPLGDSTEIGDKGVTLSGGQKARIALARAVYPQAIKLLLLDDPLSALDAHVGRWVMRHALQGQLAAGRTTLLATHQVEYAALADMVVLMHEGRVIRVLDCARSRHGRSKGGGVTSRERGEPSGHKGGEERSAGKKGNASCRLGGYSVGRETVDEDERWSAQERGTEGANTEGPPLDAASAARDETEGAAGAATGANASMGGRNLDRVGSEQAMRGQHGERGPGLTSHGTSHGGQVGTDAAGSLDMDEEAFEWGDDDVVRQVLLHLATVGGADAAIRSVTSLHVASPRRPAVTSAGQSLTNIASQENTVSDVEEGILNAIVGGSGSNSADIRGKAVATGGAERNGKGMGSPESDSGEGEAGFGAVIGGSWPSVDSTGGESSGPNRPQHFSVSSSRAGHRGPSEPIIGGLCLSLGRRPDVIQEMSPRDAGDGRGSPGGDGGVPACACASAGASVAVAGSDVAGGDTHGYGRTPAALAAHPAPDDGGGAGAGSSGLGYSDHAATRQRQGVAGEGSGGASGGAVPAGPVVGTARPMSVRLGDDARDGYPDGGGGARSTAAHAKDSSVSIISIAPANIAASINSVASIDSVASTYGQESGDASSGDPAGHAEGVTAQVFDGGAETPHTGEDGGDGSDNGPAGVRALMDGASAVRLVEEETRAVGRVPLEVYRSYGHAAGRAMSVLILFSLLFMQASKNGSDLWLSHWVSSTANAGNHGNHTSAPYSKPPSYRDISQFYAGVKQASLMGLRGVRGDYANQTDLSMAHPPLMDTFLTTASVAMERHGSLHEPSKTGMTSPAAATSASATPASPEGWRRNALRDVPAEDEVPVGNPASMAWAAPWLVWVPGTTGAMPQAAWPGGAWSSSGVTGGEPRTFVLSGPSASAYALLGGALGSGTFERERSRHGGGFPLAPQGKSPSQGPSILQDWHLDGGPLVPGLANRSSHSNGGDLPTTSSDGAVNASGSYRAAQAAARSINGTDEESVVGQVLPGYANCSNGQQRPNAHSRRMLDVDQGMAAKLEAAHEGGWGRGKSPHVPGQGKLMEEPLPGGALSALLVPNASMPSPNIEPTSTAAGASPSVELPSVSSTAPSPLSPPSSSLISRSPSSVWTPVLSASPSGAGSSFLLIFIALGALNSVATLVRAFLFAYGGLRACSRLHARLLSSVMAAPLSFFERNPLGRILNRFSSDICAVDDSLPFILNIFLAATFSLLGVLVVLSVTLPTIIFALVPLGVLYRTIQGYYRCSSRELRRLDSLSRSPLYAAFSELLDGAPTIRSFNAGDRFIAEQEQRVTANIRTAFAELAAGQWLAFHLQMISAALVATVATMAAVSKGAHLHAGASAAMVGLSLSYALPITGVLNSLLTSFTETEKEMVAVERVDQYLTLPSEAQPGAVPPPPGWPSAGALVFEGVSLTYREGLPPSLQSLSLRVPPGEKLGIVGRTGSGKTSIFNALFRLVHLSKGRVLIDGVDIGSLDLKAVRSAVSIIPQHAFLFRGTIRENLDPEGRHSDASLWAVLTRVGLVAAVLALATSSGIDNNNNADGRDGEGKGPARHEEDGHEEGSPGQFDPDGHGAFTFGEEVMNEIGGRIVKGHGHAAAGMRGADAGRSDRPHRISSSSLRQPGKAGVVLRFDNASHFEGSRGGADRRPGDDGEPGRPHSSEDVRITVPEEEVGLVEGAGYSDPDAGVRGLVKDVMTAGWAGASIDTSPRGGGHGARGRHHSNPRGGGRRGIARSGGRGAAGYGSTRVTSYGSLASDGGEELRADVRWALSVRVTEGGGCFSSGQQQLFCLARAMLRDTKIVCLDECMANLDPVTARALERAMDVAFASRTVLIVAHRLHAVAKCDGVAVMDAGRLVRDAHSYLIRNPFAA